MHKKLFVLVCALLFLCLLLMPQKAMATDGDGDTDPIYPNLETVQIIFSIKGLKNIKSATVHIQHQITGTPYELVFTKENNYTCITEVYAGEYVIESADSHTNPYSLVQHWDTPFTISANDENCSWSASEYENFTWGGLLKKNLIWLILLPVGVIVLLIARQAGVSNNKLFTS